MKTNFLITLLIGIVLLGCGGSDTSDSVSSNDSRFAQYISGHTRGTISSQDNIRIEFTEQVTVPTDVDTDKLLSFSPSLKGSVVKTGPSSFAFSPENFSPGTTYTVTVDMTQLMEMPQDLDEYVFQFEVLAQSFEIEIGEIQVPDPTKPDLVEVEGRIATADFASNEAVEKMVAFPENLQVTWQHPSAVNHRFAISGITKNDQPQTIRLTVSGNPINVKRSQDVTIDIPSTQGFSVMSSRVELEGTPYISIYFTDPLDKDQDLKGLIALEGVKNTKTVINGNEVKLFIHDAVSGSKKLEIFEGIKNTKGESLKQNVTSYVAFEPEKPQLKLLGSGTILPSTNGLVLPFEAVNLKGVQVEVIQVFEDNIPQFLQVNEISGSNQLSRVGRMVMAKDIDLQSKADNLSIWNRFTLDLSDLFESERGALYQIRIGFRPDQSSYPCDTPPETFNSLTEEVSWSIFEDDEFSGYGGGFPYIYPPGYSWEQRDNPCHVSYYRTDKFETKSLLATDIGLIAKIGANNELKVYTTNMINAQPVGAQITVLDYQLKELATASTDENGMTSFAKPARRPFLIIAEANGQKSYLKLNDNEALSMSNFDVSGTEIRGNIKGFIYGERGVWRPGDNIFLSMLLEDPENQIPDDHPVVMELINPRGIVKDKQVLTHGLNGLYTVTTSTAADDETGNWRAKFSVGNNTFSKSVKIETVKPNRLKINLDFGDDKITASNRSASGSLKAQWLTGLTAKNLKAETELILSETKTTFKGYAQYDFDDDGKRFYDDPQMVFSGSLDEEGQTSISLDLPQKPNSPGALLATYNTKVFEPGGGFSINSKSVKYYPYTSFVGMNLVTAENGYRIERDKPQQINIVTLDTDGKPVDRSNLEFTLYKLSWRWWWDRYDDYSINYTSSSYADLVTRKNLTTQSGKGSVQFTIDSPNWGRYIAVIKDPVSGHSTSQVFYTSWYGDSDENGLGASSLQVSTDKEEYATGDKIKVTIRGSLQGQALISVENGSEVLQNFWTKTNSEWTTFEIDATPEMAPNVYLHVSLLQPHGQTTNDLPIRLYGIAPINVFDPNTKLQPVIQMADELAPESPVKVTVSETDGKAMTYTIAMVDEGLLDLTNFKTPSPWDHFYSKEAIGVKTWDIYSDVIGAYGGRLERLLSIGGGYGGEDENKQKEENRFKPVVQFAGPFYLEPGQSKTHTLQMPQYIGSVRTMVVAGNEGAYGHADKATPVVKPLMVLGTLPRVVGPGEKVTMPVNVFKYKDHLKNAKISIETSGVIQLKGNSSQSIKLDEATSTVYFDLDVTEKVGQGKVTIVATSDKETARHEINITSRSPNSPQTKVKVVSIEPGKTISPKMDLFGMEGTNEVAIEVANIPPINLERRLGYLIRYPHGCIEQTVSSVFPQLSLEDLTELSIEQKVRIENNIKAAILRLSKFQTSSGGLGYWPGNSSSSAWGTNYAYHFLIEAQKRGYLVPTNMMDRIRNYQRNQARNWVKSSDYYNSEFIQAYRLFTLAIGGYGEIGAMNRLRNTSNIDKQSIHRLAAAYAAIGQNEAARDLMKNNGRNTLKKEPYKYYYYNYGSLNRDISMLLETYIYMGDMVNAFTLVEELSKELSDGYWMSTQTTAYALLAVSEFAKAGQSDKGLEVEISYDGNSNKWSSKKAIKRMDIPASSANSVQVKNLGQSILFATLTVTGTPAPGDEPIQSENLAASVRYTSTNGRSISPDSVKMGETFEISLTVKNDYNGGQVRDIALAQILPSGWEIQNDRLNEQGSTSASSSFDYQDIRDDRIYTYFDLGYSDSKTFKIKVTAAYPGMYYLPGAYAEAMYNASISAKNQGKWVYVYK